MPKHRLELTDWQIHLIGRAVDQAMDSLEDKIYEREDDYDAEDLNCMEQELRDLDELWDDIKVTVGRAFRFDDHFTVDQLKRVWTVLDCDGKLCISTGRRYVNREYYLLTEQAWTDEDTQKDWIY